MEQKTKVFVAGHRGLVGSAIVRRLTALGYSNLVLRTRDELDLTRQAAVERFFAAERPEVVFLAAARVGGILANSTYPADFIRDNLLIQTHVIDAAQRTGTAKLVFLGSSCIYPRLAPQPIPEDALLSGPLERTNEAYAVAKIAGLVMARAYRRQYGMSAIGIMPTNLFGPHDNFSLETAHVVPALMRKFADATERRSRTVSVWGTGEPRRELLHVDDLADAAVFLAREYDGEEIVNVGTGTDVTIRELVAMLREISGFTGEIVFDTTKPDGTPRKMLDVSRAASLGWQSKIPLREGLESTYRWFLSSVEGVGR